MKRSLLSHRLEIGAHLVGVFLALLLAMSGFRAVAAARAAVASDAALGATEVDPSWSPDSRTIAFARGDAIWSVKAGGGLPVRLTHPRRNQSDSGPSWDPSGRRIVFARYEEGSSTATSRLFIMNADGSDARLLSKRVPPASAYPDWSPRRQIVFVALFNRLGVVSPDGRRLQLVAYATLASLYDPSWSSRSGPVGFAARMRQRPASVSIWTVNHVGGGLTQLTSGPDDHAPDWSPNGRTIVMSRSCRIATLNVKTRAVRFLTPAARADTCASEPDWSPDARKIAYSVDAISLYVMNRDGTDKQRIAGPRP